MESEPSPLETLGEDQCLALLKSCEVGRIGVVVDGQPLIFPVNYAFDGRSVLIHTDVGTLLRGASLAPVAFEIDSFDVGEHSGWSVHVQGIGHDVTDALDFVSEHLQSVHLSPWAPGSAPRLLRIDARTIVGLRLRGRSKPA